MIFICDKQLESALSHYCRWRYVSPHDINTALEKRSHDSFDGAAFTTSSIIAEHDEDASTNA